MKKINLILMRHGKAEKDGASDHERQLAPRGREQARKAGHEFHEIFGHIDRAIVSDSTRTRQTAAELLGSVPIRNLNLESKLYTVNSQIEFVDAITPLISNSDKTLLIVGHNPTISLLASKYTAQDFELGTGEFIIATIESADWHTALESSGCWTVKYPS